MRLEHAEVPLHHTLPPSTWAIVRHGSAEQQTAVCKRTTTPEWQCAFRFDVIRDEQLEFIICRRSRLNRVKVVGSASLTMQQVVRRLCACQLLTVNVCTTCFVELHG